MVLGSWGIGLWVWMVAETGGQLEIGAEDLWVWTQQALIFHMLSTTIVPEERDFPSVFCPLGH